MKYTNNINLPDFAVEWLEYDEYDHEPDTLSATTLMKPARMYALEQQNQDNLEIDVSDLIASRYGTAIHASVEKVKLSNCVQEKRLRHLVMGTTITGKFDILRKLNDTEYELIDVKSTSVWTYVLGGKDDEYRKQLSIYRYLAIQNGFNVVPDAKIWMVFTDWSKSRSLNNPDYPAVRMAIKNIDLWSEEQTQKYICDRICLFNETLKKTQGDMPECTDDELWSENDTWAIMKEGRKSAVKLHDTEESATEHLKTLDGKHSILLRKGMIKRCQYCLARKFCDQAKKLEKIGRLELQQ